MQNRSLACIGLALALGCAQSKQVAQEVAHQANPFDTRGALMLSVERRGPYLLAEVRTHRKFRFLAPISEACARVLVPETSVSYAKHGVFGRFRGGDGLVCDPIGSASLAAWRDRQPRQDTLTSAPVPRAQATFRKLAEDDDYVFLRGRFPLASRLSLPSVDMVALVRKQPACRKAFESGVASMEFLNAGRTALRRVGEGATCPIEGLAQPPPPGGGGGA